MTSHRWSIGTEDLPQCRDLCGVRQLLPEELGQGESRLLNLEEGLSCIETRFSPNRSLAIRSRIEEGEPRLVLTLGLAGRSSFVGDAGEEVVFSEGYATITAFNSSVGERQYDAKRAVTQLRLTMSKPWLQRYFGEAELTRLFSGHGVRVLRYDPLSAQALIAGQSLLAGGGAGRFGDLFLRGQALTVLAAELAPLAASEEGTRLSARDWDMVRQARDILCRELQNPPSVEGLAKRVGTNTFKLKQLFHRVYNDTPYGMLLKFRMEKALAILDSTRCPVHVVAALVGYAHASNFSSAFTRYFGFPPARIARSRRMPRGKEGL